MNEHNIPAAFVCQSITAQIAQLQNPGWRAMALAPADETTRRAHLVILANHRGSVLGTAIRGAALDVASVEVSKRAAIGMALGSSTVLSSGGLIPTLSKDLAEAVANGFEEKEAA